MEPYNYSALVGDVPNYLDQVIRGQQLQGLRLGNQAQTLANTATQDAAEEESQYDKDVAGLGPNPSPTDIMHITLSHPTKAAAIKQAFAAQDEAKQRTAFTTLGSAFYAANAGKFDIAANALRPHVEADKAAGHADPVQEAALADLESGDPVRQKSAAQMLGGFLRTVGGPEHMGSINEALGEAGADTFKAHTVGRSIGHYEMAEDGKRRWVMDYRDPDPPQYRELEIPDPNNPGQTIKAIVAVGGGGGAGAPASTGGGGAGPRSVRNNNPGNLRDGPFAKSQPGYKGADDAGYAIFDAPEHGQAAQSALLNNRYIARGQNTVASIIQGVAGANGKRTHGWAPRESDGGDNTDAQVNNYIAFVAKRAGVKPGEPIPPEKVPAVAAAMAAFESGATGKGGATRTPVVPSDSGANIVARGAPVRDKPSPGYRWAKDGKSMEPIPGGPADGEKLGPADLQMMGQQYLAGDKSVLQNLGRGKQGSANIVALRREIARQAQDAGMTGRDIAAQMAEFSGLVAGERTLGTRTANAEMASTEFQQLAPLALQASHAASRSGFVPLAKAQQMIQAGTNDPNLRRFVASNTSLINVYARAISPTGVPTVSDKEHGRDMLSTAFDEPSYRAVVDQMSKEIAAARRSPGAVRGEFRRAISGNLPVMRSPAEASRLPSGTHFRTPDGREKVRP